MMKSEMAMEMRMSRDQERQPVGAAAVSATAGGTAVAAGSASEGCSGWGGISISVRASVRGWSKGRVRGAAILSVDL
jgi:hypothetical protein